MNFIKTFLAGLLAFVVGTFLVFFIWIFVLMGIAGSMEKSVAVSPESILRIDFSEIITDSPSSDPLAGLNLVSLQRTRQLPLLQALRAIEAAASDDRIKGIYLRMNGGGGVAGTALLEELREALEEFGQTGKFIVAYNEVYSQGQYYLASVADRIYMQPEGGMDWSGLSMNLMFYKGLFDKLDLKAEVFRPTVCRYKSAVEPYILDRMSDENREQMQELVNSVWGTISGTVAAARGIDSAAMREITDRLQVTLPEDALEHGFVDGLIYEDQMKEVFSELGVADDGEGNYEFVSLGDYASMVGPDLDNLGADRVAVVYADGQIVDGEGYGEEIYGNTLAAKLAGVREDEKVKAVVLRVNSPGGSALASDVIWREMELLKAEKPVVVSMGFLCRQRRILHFLSGRRDRGRPHDADRFDRGFRHVHKSDRRAEEQAGRHARRREEQRFGRHGVRIGADARRAGFDHARRGQGVRDLHGACGRGAQPARRTGARDRRRPRVVGRGCAGDRTHRHLRRSEDGHRDGRGQGGDGRRFPRRRGPRGTYGPRRLPLGDEREHPRGLHPLRAGDGDEGVRSRPRGHALAGYSDVFALQTRVVAGRKPCRMTGGGFLHGNPPPVSYRTAEGGKEGGGITSRSGTAGP